MNAPIQAFVLKCPECGAPQPGTTPTCAYCKVPLMWAPSRRVGSDDYGFHDVEDEPGTELMAFGPETIRGGEVQHFQMQPQKPVRPKFLWIHPRCSDGIYVSNLHLGVSVMLDAGGFRPISGSLFSRGRGFPLESEMMMPGIMFSFDISNSLAHPLSVEGVIRVMPMKDPPRPLSGSGYGHTVGTDGRLRERYPGEWGPVIVGGKTGDKIGDKK